MSEDYVPGFRFDNNDEVDLLALRYALKEAQLVTRELMDDIPENEGYRQAQIRAADERGRNNCAHIAARECVRLEGEKPVAAPSYSIHRRIERQYSMYALHPDTAEQIIAAIEYLIKRQGSRLRFHSELQRHAPTTVRNTKRPASADLKEGK